MVVVVPAQPARCVADAGARAGTHAAACRGRDGSRLFAATSLLALPPLGRDDSGGREPRWHPGVQGGTRGSPSNQISKIVVVPARAPRVADAGCESRDPC